MYVSNAIAPSKNETSTQSWTNVGPPSTMSAQHWSNNGSMCRVCWVVRWHMTQCVYSLTLEYISALNRDVIKWYNGYEDVSEKLFVNLYMLNKKCLNLNFYSV